MIDHVLGRPSTKFRKIQVFAVVSFWSLYLFRGNNHGPPFIRALSSRLSGKLTVWQSTVILLLWLYVCRNFAKIVGLESPEPLANLYSRSFFRATWITTALDAGFWTAMKVKPKWLRDLASLAFTVYYLIAAERADDKVRRVRAMLTVEHLRVSWNKGTSPYLWALAGLLRPRLTRYAPRAIRIPRPKRSAYKEPTHAWLYFDGPLSALREQTCVVLDIPGGGFVAMNPRTCEDKLLAWAGKTKVPVLSLDYKKAPEHPYPYALNECYDVYHTIVATRGRCLGLSGQTRPKVVICGDSAGGNLAVGLTLMILQSGSTDARRWQGEDELPRPDGLVLIYPSLNMRVESWMSEEQLSLIQDKSARRRNQNVLQRKNEDYYKLTPSTTPGPSGEDLIGDLSSPVRNYFDRGGDPTTVEARSEAISKRLEKHDLTTQATALAENQPRQIHTRLAVSSIISYVHDRILTTEMMRAMIILYIGPYNRPDFSTDYLLSPIIAPEALLARFPKTYFLTGERDPLVDDTVIFAGRIRQAKLHQFRERQELGLVKSQKSFNEKDHVEVALLPGISHGFLQMAGFFPDSWKHIDRCARWINDLFETAELAHQSSSSLLKSYNDINERGRSDALKDNGVSNPNSISNSHGHTRHHHRTWTGESSADEDKPLEMSMGALTPMPPPMEEGAGAGAVVDRPRHAAQNGDSRDAHRERITPHKGKAVAKGKPSSMRSNLRGRRDRPPAPLTLNLPPNQMGNHTVNGTTPDVRFDEDDDERNSPVDDHGRVPPRNGIGIRKTEREKSFTSLPSEEDLLHRRMMGIAGGLMGLGEGARTP